MIDNEKEKYFSEMIDQMKGNLRVLQQLFKQLLPNKAFTANNRIKLKNIEYSGGILHENNISQLVQYKKLVFKPQK